MASIDWRLVSKQIIYGLLLNALFLTGSLGGNGKDDNNEDAEDAGSALVIGSLRIAGVYLVLFIVVLVFCGGFSLLSFIVCWCKDRLSKRNRIRCPETTPHWVSSIQPHASLVDSGFGACSDGITIENPHTVHRHRPHELEVDGAKWSKGLSTGKHVFEIIWSKPQRGKFASVGVVSALSGLYMRPPTTLVGTTPDSWGFDIIRKRSVHNGRLQRMCIALTDRRLEVPDRFLMYVDCDSGKISWGTEDLYWGGLIEHVDRSKYPLYVAVGLSAADGHVQVVYKGSAVDSPYGSDPTQPLESSVAQAPPYSETEETPYSLGLPDKKMTDSGPAPPYSSYPPRAPDSPPPPYRYSDLK